MNRILVIGPSWVGDMVMSQSLFKALKQNDPGCVIDVLAPAWSLPILERMPEVRKGIVMPLKHGEFGFGKRFMLGQSLKDQYDQAILLPNSLKSAFVPFFAGIKIRTGWRGEMRYLLLNDIRQLDEEKLPLMVQRFVALAYPKETVLPDQLPKPRLVTTDATQQLVIDKYRLSRTRKTLVLCPGAEFGNAKQWPDQHYAILANQKIAEGWQVWILGSRNDQAMADSIINHLDAGHREHCQSLAGRTELVETIDLIALANAVVTNDSGLMHIAAAVNTPLVVVYGSTSPRFTPPLSEKVRIIKSDISCAPCFERTCPLGHRKCLVEQMPARVLSELNQLVTAA